MPRPANRCETPDFENPSKSRTGGPGVVQARRHRGPRGVRRSGGRLGGVSAAVAAGSPLEGWVPADPHRDQFVVVHGVTWAGYCLMRDLLDGPGVRLTYLEG